jgi:hypothetical protein
MVARPELLEYFSLCPRRQDPGTAPGRRRGTRLGFAAGAVGMAGLRSNDRRSGVPVRRDLVHSSDHRWLAVAEAAATRAPGAGSRRPRSGRLTRKSDSRPGPVRCHLSSADRSPCFSGRRKLRLPSGLGEERGEDLLYLATLTLGTLRPAVAMIGEGLYSGEHILALAAAIFVGGHDTLLAVESGVALRARA